MTRLALAVLALTLIAVPSASAATLPADSTAILSGQASLLGQLPAPRNDSFASKDSVSTDGRFVAFESTSDGFSAEDNDNVINIYVKDRVTGTVTFVSRATGANGAPAARESFQPAISDDGTHVAFITSASLDPADANDHADVYVRDLVNNTTELVSRATGADGAVANQFADDPALSAAGTRVAFETSSTNLSATAQPAVYVRDLQTHTTTLVSLADNESLPNGDSTAPSISNDGNLVAFSSRASNLVTGDNNGVSDVFVRNINAGTTDLVSRATGGAIATGGDSFVPSISGSGNVVAFESQATNLGGSAGFDVYRHSGNTTELLDKVGATKANAASFDPELNDDGSVAIFRSQATNLDPSVTGGITDAIYVAKGGTVEVASRGTGALGAPAGEVVGASIGGDGKQVLFGWLGRGVLPGDEPFVEGIALRDVDQHTTSPVAVPPGVTTFTNPGDFAADGVLSADGRYTAFVTGSTALGAPAGGRAVVVRDTATGAAEVASREDGPGGALMTGRLFDPAISANGRRVVFTHQDDNGHEQIWLRDLNSGTTVRVDATPDGTPANGDSTHASIDASGLRVAFLSQATNLDPADKLDGDDVYVRDFAANTVSLASRTVAGARSNGVTDQAQISGNGDHVVFVSQASDLGDGDTDRFDDVHIRDLSAGTTRLVSVSSDGVKSTGSSDQASISFDGSRVAFSSTGDNLGAPPSDQEQIFLRDLAARTTTLVSRFSGAGDMGDGDSFDPRISANGQVVAFDSRSTNLVPGVPDDTTETYRRDLASNATDLVSRAPGANGAAGAGDSEDTGITADGACVAFTGDGNAFEGSALGRSDFVQVYMRALKADCGRPPASADRDTTPPRLRGVSLSRSRFRIAKAATKVSDASIAAKKRKLPGRGTTLRFTTSEAATLSIRIDRVLPGRKAGKGRKRTCQPVRHRVKRGRCNAFRRRATLTRHVKAGKGSVKLSGRIGRRKMAAGRYRLTLTARDAAGNVSKPVRRSFAIVPG